MDSALGGEVVERQQLVDLAGDLLTALGNFAPYAFSNGETAFSACARSSALQISYRAFFAPDCADFGSVFETLIVL